MFKKHICEIPYVDLFFQAHAWITKASNYRSSVWKVSDKRPGNVPHVFPPFSFFGTDMLESLGSVHVFVCVFVTYFCCSSFHKL